MAPFYRDCIRLIFRVVTLPGEKAGLSSLKPPNARSATRCRPITNVRRTHDDFAAEFKAADRDVKVEVRAAYYGNMKELRFEAADREWRAAFAFDPETKGAMVKDHVDRGFLSARFAFLVSPMEALYLYLLSRRHQSAALRALVAS